MRVLIVNQHAQDVLGGSEIQCDIIADRLGGFGHQVTYIAVKGKQASYDTSYQVIPVKGLDPFRFYLLLKSVQPDVIYWRYNKYQLFASALVSKLAGCRFVFSISCISDTKVLIESGQSLSRNLGRILTKGDILQIPVGLLRQLLLSLRSMVNYSAIPLFVDGIVSLNSEYLDKIPVMNKTSIHNSMPPTASNFCWPKPYVVWVANIKSKKNPEMYLRLAQALQDITDVDFLMIGAIQDSSYDYLVRTAALMPNFHYLGPKTLLEVNGVLKNSLFLIHTCDREGFGNNFIQAWLQAKPTVSLYFDPEGIIEREGLGFLSQTFPRLVEHTKCLIEDEDLRTTMGTRAHEFAREHFDSETNVHRLEAFLNSIAAG